MLRQYAKKLTITSLVTLLPMAAGLLLWQHLPETIATHWDAQGVPNGYSSRAFAVLGIPLFLLLCHLMCFLITQADPKRRGIPSKMLTLVLWICPMISVVCIGIVVLGGALGLHVRVEMLVPLLMGALYVVIGNLLPKCRQSYTLGIRLPWTLNSAENWTRTHRMAGIVWVIGGIAAMLCALIGLPLALFPITALMVLIPTLYSYLNDRRAQKAPR